MKTEQLKKLSIGLAIAAFTAACSPWLNVRDAAASEPESTTVLSGPLRFEERLIMGGYTYPFGIAAADLDGDGDIDLTSADATAAMLPLLPEEKTFLYWFENLGNSRFKRHYIDITRTHVKERPERHAIGDIDGDGRPDVVIVKNLLGDLLWFRNDGTPADGKTWTRHVVTKGELPHAYDVALSDLDGDGDLDVAGSARPGGSENQFAWFENPGPPAESPWKKHLVEKHDSATMGILISDLDGDGDADLVGAVYESKLVVWYENSGKPASATWKRHVIDAGYASPSHGQAVDMDADGDADVLMTLGGATKLPDKTVHQVVWYENPGEATGDAWTRHVICESLPYAIEAQAGDLDSDGDLDVAATAWINPGQVAWFENPGDPAGRWTTHTIKAKWPKANQVLVVDLDRDGRLDIAAVAERGSCEFRWWRNIGPANK